MTSDLKAAFDDLCEVFEHDLRCLVASCCQTGRKARTMLDAELKCHGWLCERC